MLQFLNLSATLAAVVIAQVTSIGLSSITKDASSQSMQANTHNLVVTTGKANTDFVISTTILTAEPGNDYLEEKRIDPAWMLGLAALAGGAAGVALAARNAKKTFQLSPTPARFSSTESNIRIEQASRQLQKKLMRLLHDERDTANRLISQVKLKNPHRSVDWCVEKVIYDLERDRGGY